jgi:hypothetical protein
MWYYYTDKSGVQDKAGYILDGALGIVKTQTASDAV